MRNKAKRRLSVASSQQAVVQTNPIARSGAPRRCPAGPGGTGPRGRRAQGNRAKQTQFRRREKQRQVLCGKGVMVNNASDRPRQNKANLSIADCRLGIADWAQTWRGTPFGGRRARSRLYKQSQTWAGWGIWGTGRRGRTKGKCAKQTQFGPRQGEGQVAGGKEVTTNRTFKEHGKNKANCQKRGTEAVARLRIADWPQTCGETTNRAKGSQFRRSAIAPADEMRKTKPICHLQGDPMDPAPVAVCRPHPTDG